MVDDRVIIDIEFNNHLLAPGLTARYKKVERRKGTFAESL